MNSKRTWPYATIATGILVTVTGWILTHTTLLLAWQLGDANSEASACASSLGILAQASDPTARAHCQLASTAQTVSAVMIWLGILVIAAGAIWLYRRMRSVPKAPEMYAAPTPLDRAMAAFSAGDDDDPDQLARLALDVKREMRQRTAPTN